MDLAEINKKMMHLKKKNTNFDLLEQNIDVNPFKQFINWFSEVLNADLETASVMTLATIDENYLPDTRVVLLKELAENKFIFYSSYNSKKARDLVNNNIAALNFYWPQFSRQVRIRGQVEKTERKKNVAYFATRPKEAQMCAHAWIQSSILPDRETIMKKIKNIEEKFFDKDVPCPENWGGYAVKPFEYEFFQGRNWRMHDRLFYILQDGKWKHMRLAP